MDGLDMPPTAALGAEVLSTIQAPPDSASILGHHREALLIHLTCNVLKILNLNHELH